MLVFPNAKINLGLQVIRRRHDGFHDIESLLYPLVLRDVLEILPASAPVDDMPVLRVTGSDDVPDTESNLCLRAVRLLRTKHAVPEVRIHLHKVIPAGSGLGGGSADAAFTLKAVNDLCKLGLPRETLMEYAGRMGSDCPFFISNTPSLVTGRGEVLHPLSPGLTGRYLLLVVPDVRIDTSLAYKMVRSRSGAERVSDIVKLPPEKWQGRLLNDFEAPVFSEYPELRAIRDRLCNSGAVYASMSGSGSALYGIYNAEPDVPEEFHAYFVHTQKLGW